MTMISIEPFEAEFEHIDDNGKRGRSPCRVVGIKEGDWANRFVVITENDGQFGSFDVDTVWRPEARELRRVAR